MDQLSQLAAMPDHPVWYELENYFRVRIAPGERQRIVHVIRQVLSEQPDLDMNELVIKVTSAVLTRSRSRR